MSKSPKKPKSNEPEVEAARAATSGAGATHPESNKQPAPEKRPLTADQKNIILASETLSGDLRDYILERLKFEKSPLPWDVRPEKEQKEVIERVTDFSTRIIERAVQMIASGGRRTMTGNLKKVLVKEGLNAQVDFSKSDELRHELFDAVGGVVLLVFSSSDSFMGSRGDVKINLDQPGLDLEQERQAAEPDFDEPEGEQGTDEPAAEGNDDPGAEQATDQLPDQPNGDDDPPVAPEEDPPKPTNLF